MPSEPVAVLGFRPHTYWTAAVALAGPSESPQVIERRRITFAFGQERFAFHGAAEMDPAEAPSFIAKIRAATEANAAREIGSLIADLRNDGVCVRVAVSAAATAKLPEELADILRVHARMHAAEGSLSRDVVASACSALGLEVRRVVERDLPILAAQLLSPEGSSLEARLKAMGAALGPPWSEDYRLATQAAWIHLGDATAD